MRSFMCLIWLAMACPLWAEDDIFAFFAEEAKAIQTVTASRLPLSVRQSPATVHVVTGEDIRAMGAQTLWDALRGVPGVDVMASRAFYGEVSLRGLNRAPNNRTLVLLDGRSVIGGPFDGTHWEALPITPDVVDRIEVVLGPASALYGANAETGVINIITREPSEGGDIRFAFGEQKTHLSTLSYGKRKDALGFNTHVSWRSANGFENSDQDASDAMTFHARLRYDWPGGAHLNVSGGLSDFRSEFSFGSGGIANTTGHAGFLSVDGVSGSWAYRAFWNRGRQRVREFLLTGDSSFDTDVLETTVSQTLTLPGQNDLVWGVTYRRSSVQADVYTVSKNVQNLWGLFAENAWRPIETVTLVASVRLDRHPLTGQQVSPRGSLVFSPNAQHVFRLSGGTSFRNPAQTETHIGYDLDLQELFGLPATLRLQGNLDLEPERLVQVEVSHTYRWGSVTTTATGFHYRLRHLISVQAPELDDTALPRFRLVTAYGNLPESARAWGGELGLQWVVNRQMTAYANYAHLNMTGDLDIQMAENGGPKHKLNLGVKVHAKGLTAGLWGHWVGATFWQNGDLQGSAEYDRVNAYWLLNGQLNYAFGGDLRGMAFGVGVSNLLNDRHYEILPVESALKPGQSGEVIGRRVLGTLSYRF